MKEMEITYELTFPCDEWLMEQINHEWDFALDEVEEDATEEEIFIIALAYALSDNYCIDFNGREAILAQSDKIYKWWKENKNGQ